MELAIGESPLSSGDASKLTALNTKLSGLKSKNVKILFAEAPFVGKKITFTINATDILKNTGTATFTVSRVDRTNPRVQLNKDPVIFERVSRDINIRGKKIFSSLFKLFFTPMHLLAEERYGIKCIRNNTPCACFSINLFHITLEYHIWT